ncbi:hypothetical protein [Lactobacillus sp. CBA3605] [Lactiplantibacillus mudanjiangensis]|uniref:helix-turn-helix domain-containing protein n=1 Tax=Lactiplantibacillus mudanjiangensis TaxID=1296538 RepID=UPI001014AA3A|nr:hypothetical protein [Lactobacillus sp. CBA3605] [Lactiplantibacillus mudanjiangensis]
MIKSKLNDILEEKNISIRELAEQTGINRASLSQLANNESKMIKFETLDKLIKALHVDIPDILVYQSDISFDINITSIDPQKQCFISTAKFRNGTDITNIDFKTTYERHKNTFILDIHDTYNDKLNGDNLKLHSSDIWRDVPTVKERTSHFMENALVALNSLSTDKSKAHEKNAFIMQKLALNTYKISTVFSKPFSEQLAFKFISNTGFFEEKPLTFNDQISSSFTCNWIASKESLEKAGINTKINSVNVFSGIEMLQNTTQLQ